MLLSFPMHFKHIGLCLTSYSRLHRNPQHTARLLLYHDYLKSGHSLAALTWTLLVVILAAEV